MAWHTVTPRIVVDTARHSARPPFELRPNGAVRSTLADRTGAPRQGREGAPDAWLEIDASLTAALDGLRVGDDVVVITWLHLADRETQRVHPRNDLSRRSNAPAVSPWLAVFVILLLGLLIYVGLAVL